MIGLLANRKKVKELQDYINSAPTPQERQRRKMQMYSELYIYPQPLKSILPKPKA
jgi:hypothetical protein